MQVYYDAQNLKLENTAVALGQFDALHIGHMEIIEAVVKYSKENNLKSLVYLFINDPSGIIGNDKSKAVNTLSKRLEILKKANVDIVVAQEFDKEFMSLSATQFIDKYLCERFGARGAFAGFNYRFGKGGAGDAELLKDECEKRGIKVNIVPEISLGGNRVSSTLIRGEIEKGNMENVISLMGRAFSLEGEVIKGNSIGEKLGFPTANMSIPTGQIIPKFGVYISYAIVDGKKYSAITNIGPRPTVKIGECFVETYIDGFSENLYGKQIEVEFLTFIRDIKKFENFDELKIQLNKDKHTMKNYFKGDVLK